MAVFDVTQQVVANSSGIISGNTRVNDIGGDEVWIGEKFQSNPEIAGSPRNSFRASLDTDLRR